MPFEAWDGNAVGAEREREWRDGSGASRSVLCSPSSVLCPRALIMRAIKCLKGVRWMPWHAQAMKDVVRCDKPWGAANKL